MKIKALIDTDVILDVFFNREPFAQYSVEVLLLSEKNSIEAYITPVICCNLYYLLKRQASHKKVKAKLKQLLKIVKVLNTDQDIVVNALESDFNDFEDAIQYYSAINFKKIDTIITRNIKDYKSSDIALYTPKDFMKMFSKQG